MIVSIIGSRDWGNYNGKVYQNKEQVSIMKRYLDLLRDGLLLDKPLHQPISGARSGGAKGADTLAELWCKRNSITITIIKPDYTKYGKGATFKRNIEIVAAPSEMTIAFYLGTAGTKHAMDSTVKAGRRCMVIDEKGEWKWWS